MRQLHEKTSVMIKSRYAIREKIVSAERRIRVSDKHLSMWEQYEKSEKRDISIRKAGL